jgi:hypothetical protein
MRMFMINIMFSFTIAMMSAEQHTPLRQPIPIVQYIDSPPFVLRKRPLKRMYARV